MLRACIFDYLDRNREQFESKVKDDLDFYEDKVLTDQLTQANDPKFDNKKLNEFHGRKEWRELLKDDNRLSIAINYQKHLYDSGLQDWRNAIAHGKNISEPDLQGIIQKAVKIKNTGPLWSPQLLTNTRLKTGECFLSQPYVTQIEKQLDYGENTSKEVYQELSESLLNIVRCSIYAP